ncbi:hypothetical protein NCS57_00509400 [Fusarium keratoplasticum]|uniref:Uncharacterized protein n=1 Tax=Fusarium keratoplasticum TaxID=1328300 RepID=A0ACC0RAS2_9HYPO|nr:hypothetical protein NCS57_00509400 [Fusarium keratoplasticum]KAI8676061.1 hypothetical protein NCS57_00509400 [Fusarium keratoplasticum]
MRRTVAERQQQSSGFLSYVNGERVEDPKFVMPATAQLGMISRSTATPSAVSNNDLTCCWNACRQQFNTPELLFEHLCEWHVGRKTTNNLNLTCQWGVCHTATVKRDRMISHMRVHVPLKPYKCKVCGKCIKRPQDLKKHIKSHADPMALAQPRKEPSGGRNDRQLSRNGSATHHDQGNQMQINTVSLHQAAYPSGHYAPQALTSCGLYLIRPPVNSARVEYSGYSTEPRSSDHIRTLGLLDDSGNSKCHQVDSPSHAQIDRFSLPLHYSFSDPDGPTAPSIPQPANLAVAHGDPIESYNSMRQQYHSPAPYIQEGLNRINYLG